MLYYDEDTQKLEIVAKDTGDFTLTLDNYTLDEGDQVVFTINSGVEIKKPMVQKKVSSFDEHNAVFHLSARDTDIKPGNYYYDIQVNAADGRVDTVVGPAKFKVIGGITY